MGLYFAEQSDWASCMPWLVWPKDLEMGSAILASWYACAASSASVGLLPCYCRARGTFFQLQLDYLVLSHFLRWHRMEQVQAARGCSVVLQSVICISIVLKWHPQRNNISFPVLFKAGVSLRKVNRHVDFPLVLDLAPFCSASCKVRRSRISVHV